MKIRHLLIAAAVFTNIIPTYAQQAQDSIEPIDTIQANVVEEAVPFQPQWTVSAQFGGSLAFGDDSWNVFKDFADAQGSAFSISLGREFTPIWGARLKARWLKLYNRVNLETYDAFHQDYPDLFPRKGFYGYNMFALQAEALLNVTNFWPNRKCQLFNLIIVGGLGMNTASGYDKHVSWWTQEAGELPGGWFSMDTRSHTMASGILGGILDFRIWPNVSLNLEALATFTGDLMEGVKYEEGYDVYITYSIGATVRF